MECYKIVISLFTALDRTIRDAHSFRLDYQGRALLANAYGAQGDKDYFAAFYHRLSQKLPPDSTIFDKIELRKKIIDKIDDFDDQRILKELF